MLGHLLVNRTKKKEQKKQMTEVGVEGTTDQEKSRALAPSVPIVIISSRTLSSSPAR